MSMASLRYVIKLHFLICFLMGSIVDATSEDILIASLVKELNQRDSYFKTGFAYNRLDTICVFDLSDRAYLGNSVVEVFKIVRRFSFFL